MTQAEYDVVTNELMALARSIEDGKRPGYTIGSRDVLANFKRGAERAGVNVGQAWTVLFLKHIDAIVAVMTQPDLPQAEAPPGRFADAINYLRLGFAILNESPSALGAGPKAASVLAEPTPRFGQAYAAMGCTTTQPSAQTVAMGTSGE